jgi:hypothetical protein
MNQTPTIEFLLQGTAIFMVFSGIYSAPLLNVSVAVPDEFLPVYYDDLLL